MPKFKSSSYSSNKFNINKSNILLLINNQRNVELLGRFLDNKYTTFAKYEDDIQFDLILVDNINYQSQFSLMKKMKNEQKPIFLPLILLHQREDAVDYTSKMMNIADEYILTPVKKDVLKNRIKGLLKTRQLTKESYYLNIKYLNIFNNINDMVFLHKIDLENKKLSNFIEINDKVVEKLGYNKEELLNMKPTNLVYHELRSPFFNYYLNKLKKKQEVLMSTKIIKKDDSLLKVELNSKIIDLDDEKVVLSVIRDISDRTERVQELSLEKVKVKKLNDFLNRLINLSKGFSSHSKDNQKHFLKEIMAVAYEYIDEANSGYISIYKDQRWRIIEIVGYDKKTVGKLNKKRDKLIKHFEQDYNNKIIRINNLKPELFLSESITEEIKDEFRTINKEIKESMFFDQNCNENSKIRLSLDIGAESSANFNDNSEILMTLFKNFLYAYINLVKDK